MSSSHTQNDNSESDGEIISIFQGYEYEKIRKVVDNLNEIILRDNKLTELTLSRLNYGDKKCRILSGSLKS